MSDTLAVRANNNGCLSTPKGSKSTLTRRMGESLGLTYLTPQPSLGGQLTTVIVGASVVFGFVQRLKFVPVMSAAGE